MVKKVDTGIERRAAEVLRGRFGQDSDWRFVTIYQAGHAHGDRAILRAAEQTGTTLILKLYAEPRRAAEEFEALAEISGDFDGIVRPLWCEREAATLALEDLGDTCLADHLAGPARPGHIAAAGRLLRDYVNAADLGAVPMEADKRLAHLRMILGRVGHNVCSARLPERLDRLERLASGLNGAALRHANIHGDVSLRNIMLAHRGPVLIDRPTRRRGLTLEDSAQFLFALETLRFNRPDVEGADAEAEWHTVLGDLPDPLDRRALHLCMAILVTLRWIQGSASNPESDWCAFQDAWSERILSLTGIPDPTDLKAPR